MPAPLLDREEYVEQAYFFRVYRERIEDSVPAQDALRGIREELLATARLPLAIDFLAGEIQLHGRMGEGMEKLTHYFAPFQAYVIQRAEAEESKFEMRMALRLLEKEAEYRAQSPQPEALFVYQFECLARHHLGYDRGLSLIAEDGLYDQIWREWIIRLRRQLGEVDFADLIYLRSQHRVEEIRRRTFQPDWEAEAPVLFGAQEGRIAKAHRGKDPLFMFAALQRHLGYPAVPRPALSRSHPVFDPPVEFRFQRLETRVALLEAETKGGIDLSQFYKHPESPDDVPKTGDDV